jgi:ELWxxDGT repeat protein
LWITDGTAAGTVELARGVSPRNLTVLGTVVLFTGVDANGNSWLWVSDGTAAGTLQLSVTGAAATGFDPGAFTPLRGGAVFAGTDADGTAALWFTDGTAAGTRELVAGINPQFRTEFGG